LALVDAPAARAEAGPRLYTFNADPRFQRLRRLMEDEWTPQLTSLLDIPRRDLPMIWDADFMLGPPGADRQLRAWRDQRQFGVPDPRRGAGRDRPPSCRSAAVEARMVHRKPPSAVIPSPELVDGGAGMTGPLIDSVPTFRCERGQRAATTVTLLAAATSMDRGRSWSCRYRRRLPHQ
jgi:hypothetical protein